MLIGVISVGALTVGFVGLVFATNVSAIKEARKTRRS